MNGSNSHYLHTLKKKTIYNYFGAIWGHASRSAVKKWFLFKANVPCASVKRCNGERSFLSQRGSDEALIQTSGGLNMKPHSTSVNTSYSCALGSVCQLWVTFWPQITFYLQLHLMAFHTSCGLGHFGALSRIELQFGPFYHHISDCGKIKRTCQKQGSYRCWNF